MPKNPTFELFEWLCTELASRSPIVVSEEELGEDLLDSLKEYFEETSAPIAFRKAIDFLIHHFQSRGVDPPFAFLRSKQEFSIKDADYISFIAKVTNRRGISSDAPKFEVEVLDRLCQRLTGLVCRVGTPRRRYKRKSEYAKFLKTLGFLDNALNRHDKDGGFDILWLPPLGEVPIRLVASIQCKNSSFNERDANSSVGRATRTLNRHSHVRQLLNFVVFYDYIDESYRD